MKGPFYMYTSCASSIHEGSLEQRTTAASSGSVCKSRNPASFTIPYINRKSGGTLQTKGGEAEKPLDLIILNFFSARFFSYLTTSQTLSSTTLHRFPSASFCWARTKARGFCEKGIFLRGNEVCRMKMFFYLFVRCAPPRRAASSPRIP